MRIERLSQRQRRQLALALLVVGLALAYAILVRPVASTFASYRSAIQDSAFLIERMHRAVEDVPAFEARAEQLRQQTDTTRQYLQRESTALAAADLQQQIGQMVSSAGGQLVSTQVVPYPGGSGYTGVALRVRITGDSPVLRQVLHAVESSREPFLFVDNLDIRVSPQRQRRGEPADMSENLTVTFDLIGYLRE